MPQLTYLPPQGDERNLTLSIQEQSWVNSFAYNILYEKQEIKTTVKKMQGGTFKNYSGIKEAAFLGDFFYIARYVDDRSNKAKYGEIHQDQQNSPMKTKKEGYEFDKKPWDVDWSEIPSYTKDHIFNFRVAIGSSLGLTLNRRQDYGRETADEYKAHLLVHIGELYNPYEDKLKFIAAAAVAGTSYPLAQAQIDNTPYIQGYIMNVLELEVNSGPVSRYYQQALNNRLDRMGLLSGPSGTSHRVTNLVREIYGGLTEELQLKTAGLCLAALGVPYNNHSFYEVVTVVLPNKPELHTVEAFIEEMKQYALIPS